MREPLEYILGGMFGDQKLAVDLVLENASQEHKCKIQRLKHLAVMKSDMYDKVIGNGLLVLPMCDEIACLV